MHTLNRLQAWLLRRDVAAAAAGSAPLRDSGGTAAEPRWSCGWFDSSHELVSGLQVRELSTPESLAAELPFAAWVEVQLAACVQPPQD